MSEPLTDKQLARMQSDLEGGCSLFLTDQEELLAEVKRLKAENSHLQHEASEHDLGTHHAGYESGRAAGLEEAAKIVQSITDEPMCSLRRIAAAIRAAKAGE